MYTTTIVHELDTTLLKRWQHLWNTSDTANFHNSPYWFQACQEGLESNDYKIIVIESNGELDAIFPLVWGKRFGIRTLCSPGEGYVDKSSLLLKEKNPKLLQALITQLKKMGNFYLEELSEEITDLMISLSPELVKQKASVSYYLPLNLDPFAYMSSKNRNKIKNRIQNNAEHLSFFYYQGEQKTLDIVYEIDARSTKSQQGKASFARDKERKFLQALLKLHGENLTVSILAYDGEPMVYGIGLIYKKTFHAFITAYDGKYTFLSPGKLIHSYLFEELKKRGIEIFDFSRGITALKKDFTSLLYIQYDMLFSKNKVVNHWWRFCDWLYYFILENKLLYKTYLLFKNFFIP